jgi:hypothetical protein
MSEKQSLYDRFVQFMTISSDSDDESEPRYSRENPFELDLTEYEYTSEIEVSETIERTVELIHFTDGQTLVVEYDEVLDMGDEREYRAVTGLETRGNIRNSDGDFVNRVVDNTVTEVKEMAVTHRQEVDTFEVTVTADATRHKKWYDIENEAEIPDYLYSDAPNRTFTKSKAFKPNDGFEMPGGYGCNSFERMGSQLIYGRRYWVEDIRNVEIDAEKTIADVLESSVIGGTDQLRATSANGNILLPDSDIGSSGDSSDTQWTKALPEE